MDATDRREFLKKSGELAAGAALGGSALSSLGISAKAAQAAEKASGAAPSKMIAIQVGAVSFVDEGIERCLDVFQQHAGVNTVIPAVFSFSSGTSGRHKPYPGHGQAGDTAVVGGNFATVHPTFYKDVPIDLGTLQAPDHPGFDVLRDLIPHTRKRGMKVIGLIQNSFNEKMVGAEASTAVASDRAIQSMLERDSTGQVVKSFCFNSPYYRNFISGLVDDTMRSYDLDGLMFVNETQGAFNDMIGARFRGRERGLPGSRTCFCEYCISKGREQGIRVDRLKTAFEEAEKFVAAGRAHERPVDGFYVSYWRLLLRHPELLQWEHLYHESAREIYRLMYERVKAARKDGIYGLHIWTNASMSPIYRAEQDFAALSECADFLKLALYNNCGGPRMASYIQSIGDTVYGDLPLPELAQFHYRILDYPNEAPYPTVSEAGLSPDYLYRECKRASAAAGAGGAKILSGVDVDIPLSRLDIVEGAQVEKACRTTRARVKEATAASLEGGAEGIVISRKYSEMKIENLSGVGDALREAGLLSA